MQTHALLTIGFFLSAPKTRLRITLHHFILVPALTACSTSLEGIAGDLKPNNSKSPCEKVLFRAPP